MARARKRVFPVIMKNPRISLAITILGVLFIASACGSPRRDENLTPNSRINQRLVRANGVRSRRSLFSPRLEYDEWTPLGRGDPLKNDPTYDYVPPVLDRVHYWIDPSSRTPDVPRPTPAAALPPPTTSPTTLPSSPERHLPVPPTTVVVYPSHARNPIQTDDHPFDAVADSRLDTHPFLTFVDGPKFTPKQPPITPSTIPPHQRVTHYGEFRPLSTHQPHEHLSSQPMRQHSSHPYRMSPSYYNPTRITQVQSHGPHLQLEEGEVIVSTIPGHPPTPLQMLVPPPLPGTETQIPFSSHNYIPREQTIGQTLTSPEMQKPSPATATDPNTTPVYPVFTAPTTSAPRIVIPTHPPTPTTATDATLEDDAESAFFSAKAPEQYMVPPPNDPLAPIPDFGATSTVDVQESIELTTSDIPPLSSTDEWTTRGTNFDLSSPQTAQTTTQRPTTTTSQTNRPATSPILYVTFPPTTTRTTTTTTPTTPPTTTTPSLTTDPLFSHYKQPSAPLRGPMYLIIEGHSKVKTYGAGKNSIHGIPIVGSGEKEAAGERSKGPRRRAGSGRSLWEDPASIGMLPPPETDPSENDVVREEWLAATKGKQGVFMVPAWGTPRGHEGIMDPPMIRQTE